MLFNGDIHYTKCNEGIKKYWDLPKDLGKYLFSN